MVAITQLFKLIVSCLVLLPALSLEEPSFMGEDVGEPRQSLRRATPMCMEYGRKCNYGRECCAGMICQSGTCKKENEVMCKGRKHNCRESDECCSMLVCDYGICSNCRGHMQKCHEENQNCCPGMACRGGYCVDK